ncbi:orotidine-5'-phosphate decarboxylase [Bacteriovoracaceae bacterium]|nr:orotidine-5'-phosphate decarboxylase [Bacteriovoracaceae bacterium]
MQSKLIIAIDTTDPTIMKNMYNSFKDNPNISFKIGLEVFTSLGLKFLEIFEQPEKVFLDLKFLDIPNTVYKSVKSICRYPFKFITVHSLCGEEILQAAIRGRDEAQKNFTTKTKLLGVTLLTSMDENNLTLFSSSSTLINITELAKRIDRVGFDGIVCSALEANFIKNNISSELITVCPGIKTREIAGSNDQRRVVFTDELHRFQADYAVIGRSILNSPKPISTVNNFFKESNYEYHRGIAQ